jgi:hypothetical protein
MIKFGRSIPDVAVTSSTAWKAADAALARPADATATVIGGAIGSGTSALFKFSNFFEDKGAHALLTGLKLVISGAGIAAPASMAIRAHLYSADVSGVVLSANADKGTWKSMLAAQGDALGYVDFSTFIVGGAGSDAVVGFGVPVVSPMHLRAADDAKDLFAILVATAVYTPVNAGVHTLFASRAAL